MSQQMDPGQWDRDIEQAERRIGHRRAAERRRRDRIGRYVERGALLVLVALYVVGFASADQQRAELRRTRVSQAQLRGTASASCFRLNLERSKSNLTDSVVWTILAISAERERALSHSDIPATRHDHARSARLLGSQANRLQVTGMTDCARAVRLGLRYKPPLASPIGDTSTARIYPNVARILRRNERLLKLHSVRIRP